MPPTGCSGLEEGEVFRLPNQKGYWGGAGQCWLKGLLGQMPSKAPQCQAAPMGWQPANSHLPQRLGQCPETSPESSMGSLSADLRTWSDSPVRELSSILRSLPWMSTPSAGSRSPKARQAARTTDYGSRWPSSPWPRASLRGRSHRTQGPLPSASSFLGRPTNH